MKKKLLLLLMIMSVMLAACGSKADEETAVKSKESRKVVEVTQAAEEAEAEIDEEIEIETEETVTETVAEGESETEADVETEETTETATEAEEGKFAKGILTENGWESEWLGMRYVTADGMVMSTEEELNELMGLSKEMLSEDFSELQLKYAELSTVYEMMCTASDQVTNVSVSIENVMIDIDTDTFIDMFKATLSELSAMSMTIINEGEDVTLAGKEFKKLQCEVDYEGIGILHDYYLAMQDGRAISIVVTYLNEETAEELMSGFRAY